MMFLVCGHDEGINRINSHLDWAGLEVVTLENLFDSNMELLLVLFELCDCVLIVVGKRFILALESDGDW